MSEREEKFEKMLADILANYQDTVDRMEKLKAEGKNNTVTYKQLMAEKLRLAGMISMYKIYGLVDM